MDDKLFELGQLVISAGAREAIDALNADGFADMVIALLGRHAKGDWGEISDSDKEANDESVKNGGMMILSAYIIQGTKFWIITEHDRSATTVLLPDEY